MYMSVVASSSRLCLRTTSSRSTGSGVILGSTYPNLTFLESYLQAHPKDILFSRTIVDENVTLDYPVSSSTNVTIVLAHLGSGTTVDSWTSTTTQETSSYPMLGYVEHAGSTFWSLPNISLGLIVIGVAGIIATRVSQ